MSGRRKKPAEFYAVRVTEDGKILWRGMTLIHIKDLDEDRRKKVIEELRKLRDQGYGKDRAQRTVAEKLGVYVPGGVLSKLMKGNGEIDWDRCGPRGPYRDLKLRQAIRDRVVRLRMEGKSYGAIQEIIEQEFGVRLSKSHISYWSRDVHRPDGNTKRVGLKADSWWLAGLMMADGYLDIRHDDNYHVYRLKLAVKDEELIQKAVKTIPSYCHLMRIERDGTLYLTAKSRTLHEFLSEVRRLIMERKFDDLIQRMGEDGVKAFVRGFFDGDGSGLFVNFTNTDLNILEFIRYALKWLDIEASQPVVSTERGTTSYHVRRNQWIVRRKDVYAVFVYPLYYDKFIEVIGTTLKRKLDHIRLSQERLLKYSRKYGCRIIDEIRRRYEGGEDWVDVLRPLVKKVGANMKKKRKKPPTPFSPSNLHGHGKYTWAP